MSFWHGKQAAGIVLGSRFRFSNGNAVVQLKPSSHVASVGLQTAAHRPGSIRQAFPEHPWSLGPCSPPRAGGGSCWNGARLAFAESPPAGRISRNMRLALNRRVPFGIRSLARSSSCHRLECRLQAFSNKEKASEWGAALTGVDPATYLRSSWI